MKDFVQTTSYISTVKKGLHVLRISQQSLLPHEVDVSNNGFFLHAKYISQIVNTTLSFSTSTACGCTTTDK